MSDRRKARAEAAAWVVKLHGPDRNPGLEAAFRDWMSADAENCRQFERVTSVWDDARGIPVGGLARVAHWNRSTGIRRWATAAVVLVALGTAGLWGYWAWLENVYRTAVGERRVVHLDDGSHLSLNSDTQLVVKFSREQRRVVLWKGEAYFEVAHNANRPFVVSAGGHDVTAVGTSFQVRYDSGVTAVTLVEGTVIVSSAAAPLVGTGSDGVAPERERANRHGRQQPSVGSPGSGGPQLEAGDGNGAGSAQVVTLTPGERLVLGGGSPPKLDSPHMDAVTAWQRGEVVLEKTPLSEAILEMNRYEDEKLVIESPGIGALRISGIYHVGDSAGFAQTIAKLYHLQVTEGDHEIRLTDNRLGENDPHP